MAQFSGGYVGGGRSGPADLSALTNAINARNQRQDAAMLPNLQAYGPAGVALMAMQGDDAAARFMDRYYGKGKWDQYVPMVDVDPKTGDPTLTPPEGVPWDWDQRAAFERDIFGARNVTEEVEAQDYTRERRGPDEPERREGERPERRRPSDVTPVSDEGGEEPPPAAVQPPSPPEETPPEPVTTGQRPTMDMGGTARGVHRAGAAELTEGEVVRQQTLENQNRQYQGLHNTEISDTDTGRAIAGAAGEYYTRIANQLRNASPEVRQDLWNTMFGDRSVTLMGLSDPDGRRDDEGLNGRQNGAVTLELWQRLGENPSPQALGDVHAAVNSIEERLRAEGLAPSPSAGFQGRPQEPSPVGGPQGAVPGGTGDPRVGADVSGRVDQMSGSMSIERGVDPATGSLREQVRVGSSAVPVRNQAQHVMATHVVAGMEEPNSPRGRAGRAAMRAQARQNVPQIRQTLRETSTMVPVGAFAARVDAFVRSDPAGASMYFKEMADSLIGAQSVMADTQYKGALSRQAEATARRTEMQAEAEAVMSPEERASLLQAQARKANAEAAILEAQGNVATERAQAEIDKLLADIDLTEEEREAISGRLALGWAELDLRKRLGMMQGSAGASPFDLMLDIYKTTDDENTQAELERVMLEALGYDVSDPKWWQFWKNREITPGGGPPSPAEAEAASGEADSFVDEYSVP